MITKSTRSFALAMALLLGKNAVAQQPQLTTWLRNTNGKTASYYATSNAMPPTYTWTTTTDSADVLTVAYTTDNVYIRSNGLTDSMGKFLNPGICVSQGYKHVFPRTPAIPATKSISPKGGQIGLLINGIPIFGLSNSASYNSSTGTNTNNGAGIWNVEVGKSEGFVLDVNYGAHPQQQGAYHSHDKPFRLFRDYATNTHSPLIGYAFDGYPVYGPYGYSVALNATSAVGRMKTGYSLRNITNRTTLPYGGTPSQNGPAVNATFPIGTYCEDYEWLASNGGDLDKYNGRFCITPEYPAGTYAYFVTIDAAGTATFPYYIGIEYYGAPITSNFPMGPTGNTVTIPAGVTIYTGTLLPIHLEKFEGKKNGNANDLQWQLTGIDDLVKLELERSPDGARFSRLAEFSGAAIATSIYKDNDPLSRNYYRLKMTDRSGNTTYSPVVLLNSGKLALNVYPTPTSGQVNVAGLSATTSSQYTITDVPGHTIETKSIAAGRETFSLDLSAYGPGIYLLTVKNNSTTQSQKIIKQ